MDNQIPTVPDTNVANLLTNGTVPSKSDFVNYLNEEISSYHSDLTRPGWTTWAIVGAISAAIWLLLEQFEKSVFDLQNVFFLLLVVSFLMDAGIYLVALVSRRTVEDSGSSKFRMTSARFGQNRVGLILLIIRWAVQIILAVEFSFLVSWPITLGAIVTSALNLAGTLLLIVMSFLSSPIPRKIKPRQRGAVFTQSLLAVIALVALFGYLRAIPSLSPSIEVGDLRLASLIVAILFLIFLMVRSSSGQWIL